MLRKLFVLVSLALSAFSGGLYAQVDSIASGSVHWNLRQCIDYAKKNNITINSMRLTANTDQQQLIQSQAARYPDLSGNLTQNLEHYNSGFYTNSGIGASSSVILYQGGYLKNDIKSKQFSLEAANLNVSAAENDITLQITQAFLNILLANENISYFKDLVATSQSQVQQGQQFFNAGTLAKAGLLQLEAALASDQYSLVQAANTKRQNAIILKQILQLPANISFDVTDSIPGDTAQPITPLDQAIEIALNTRPEVKSGALGVQVEQAELEKAKSGLRPTLSLGGALGTNYAGTQTGKYFSQVNNNFYQQLGLTLGIPILDRKVTKTNTEMAKIAIDQAKLSLQDTKTTLAQSVEQAYINLENAQNQFSAAVVQLNYAEENFRIAEQQLKIGVFNLVDYLQQKNLYVQAQQQYLQAKYSSILYEKIYNFYLGIPVTQ